MMPAVIITGFASTSGAAADGPGGLPDLRSSGLVLSGWDWRLVLVIAVLAVFIALRWQAPERAGLSVGRRRTLAWLRGTAIALTAAFLLAPALSIEVRSLHRPAVALVVDTSASMAADDRWATPGRRLDEAQALGLLPAEARNLTARRAAACARAAIATDAGEDRIALGPALALATAIPDAAIAEEARSLADELAADRADAQRLAAFAERAEATQARVDAALVQAAGPLAPVTRALAACGRLSRAERAQQLARRAAEILAGQAEVQWFTAAEQLTPVAAGAVLPAPAGATDTAAVFAALSRDWAAQDHPGAVLWFSDGRQTLGGDADPALRSLAARGVTVSAVAIGEPAPPRDAVVAALLAPDAVVTGDLVRLTVRWRVHGLDAHPWHLVVLRDDVEVARRAVTPDGTWQEERFDRSSGAPGSHRWTARIESPSSGGDGLPVQCWTGLAGNAVDDLRRAPGFPDRPVEDLRSGLQFTSPEDRGWRLAGWVVPPQTGDHVLRVTSDDASEVRLAADGDPGQARTVCAVPGWTAPGDWNRFPTQRSQPVALTAGVPAWIEVLYKQGKGPGHCTVGWELPDGGSELPIPRERLRAARHAAATAVAEADTANNSASAVVAVVDDPLRMLLLDDGPRWEARFLAGVFARDRRTRVEQRWRGWETEHLLPADAELDACDVVVLGDCDANDLGPDAGARLAAWVGRRGGFLIVIAGPRAMPAAHGPGPIADLLPVRIAGAVRLEDVATPLALGAAGLTSPITAIAGNDEANRQAWAAAPVLGRVLRGTVAKTGAGVLLASADAQRSPVAVVQRYGAGRVLWLGTDGTWRWRAGDEDLHHAFWTRAVRWGLGERLRGADPRLQAALDRAQMDTMDRAELRLRVRAADGTPALRPPRVVRERLTDGGEPVAGTHADLAPVAVVDAPGTWHLTMGGLAVGDWRITVHHPDDDACREVRHCAVRRLAGRETVELAADPGALTRLTGLAHGRTVEALDADDEARRIAATLVPRSQVRRWTYSLWDDLWPVVAVVALLLAEWTVRRWSGRP